MPTTTSTTESPILSSAISDLQLPPSYPILNIPLGSLGLQRREDLVGSR